MISGLPRIFESGGEILIVDDTPANLQLLYEILTEAGYRVRPASHGRMALESVAVKRPDLILLDVKMPGMGGFEVCQRLKGDPRSRDIPVVFVSALEETFDKVRGFEQGATDYITKPFAAPEVLVRVKTHLTLSRTQRALAEANDELGRLNVDLEGRVLQRTSELARANQALQRSNERARAAHELLIEQEKLKTERVAAELGRVRDELIRTTRLATIGQISASIAHDLRNPLASVRNAAYLLGRRLQPRSPELSDPLSTIDNEISRANGIITALMSIAGAHLPQKERIELEPILKDICGVCFDGQGARYRIELHPNPFVVFMDPGQLRQVVTNLVSNAAYALEGSGTLTIRAAEVDHSARIEFIDTGKGIDPSVIETLFEPLVTTKARGTGLGLTICRQIVESHGGRIEAGNTEQGGARFRIRVPQGVQ